ncbi:hypothetical protein C8R44DRAFT_422517 [Mycena epipterygia]|nr:hypothetical protein C8R44DRAFT_422517 [Mycena epipterygia]
MPGKRRKQDVPAVDSPFSEFLKTNPDRLPSLQETRFINDLVVEKLAHLALLNSRVPRRKTGKKTPPQLRVEIDDARRFIKFHRALLAPWRRLPAEIISEIFVFTLSPVPIHTVAHWDDDRAGTLLLCRICRSWRDIALSTPSLWTVLSVRLHISQSPFDWLPLWLNRSRSLPIHLQVIWDGTTSSIVLDRVLSSVLAHIQHIGTLLIYGLDYMHIFPGPSYPRATFPSSTQPIEAPLLTTLEASFPPRSNYDWIFALCQAAPNLTSFHTAEFFPDRVPTSQLTTLHIVEPVPIDVFLRLLKDAPCLKDVAVDLGGPSVASPAGSILVVKTLQKLEITSHHHLGVFFRPGRITRPNGYRNLPNGCLARRSIRSFPHSIVLRSEKIVLRGNGDFRSPGHKMPRTQGLRRARTSRYLELRPVAHC